MCIVVQNVNPWMNLVFWSILTDTLQYVKAEVDSSVTYSFDQKRFQNSKSRYFDEKSDDFSNKNTSIDKNFNAKKENFDAANYNVPNCTNIFTATVPKFVEDRYGNLSLFTTSYFKPQLKVSVQLISGQRIIIVPNGK